MKGHFWDLWIEKVNYEIR